MAERVCLNCGEVVANQFCPACGQSADTERFTIRRFITQDLAKVLVKLNGGVLFTLKQLFTRPGHAVREYNQGKRVGFVNAPTLLVLLASFDAYLRTLWKVDLSMAMTSETGRSLSRTLEDARINHTKLLWLGLLPLRALFSYLFFRRAGQRYAEHLVLDCYGVAGGLTISVFASAFVALSGVGVDGAHAVTQIAGAATFGYFAILYYQYFSRSGYSKLWLAVRSVGVPVSLLFSLTFVVWLYFTATGR